MRTMNPDQSIMPVWGSIRRTGARIGSVVWKRNVEIWFRPVGSTQDMIIRPKTSAQSAINRNLRKVRKNVPATVHRVYQPVLATLIGGARVRVRRAHGGAAARRRSRDRHG